MRLFSRWNKDEGEKQATVANLGNTKSQQPYYDKDAGRWRFPGQEHLEKETAAPPPPPKAAEPKPPDAAEGPGSAPSGAPPPMGSEPPKPAASAADQLCAPPNIFAGRLGANRAVSSKAPPMASASPFGAPPQAAAGDGAPAPASNPFAKGGFSQPVNPHAPRAMNPNAPRAMNPHAPRAIRRPDDAAEPAATRHRPSPFAPKPSPFAAQRQEPPPEDADPEEMAAPAEPQASPEAQEPPVAAEPPPLAAPEPEPAASPAEVEAEAPLPDASQQQEEVIEQPPVATDTPPLDQPSELPGADVPAFGQASESLGFEDFPEAADAPPAVEEVVTEPAAVTEAPAEVPPADTAAQDGLDALLEDPWLVEGGDPMPAADSPPVPDVVKAEPEVAAAEPETMPVVEEPANPFGEDVWDDIVGPGSAAPPVSTSTPPVTEEIPPPAEADVPRFGQESIDFEDFPTAQEAAPPISQKPEAVDFEDFPTAADAPPVAEESEPAAGLVAAPGEAPAEESEQDMLNGLMPGAWMDEAGDPLPAADAPPVADAAEPSPPVVEEPPAAADAVPSALEAELAEFEGFGEAADAPEPPSQQSAQDELADFEDFGTIADAPPPSAQQPEPAASEDFPPAQQEETVEPVSIPDTAAEAPAAAIEQDGLDALLEDPWLDEAGDPMPAADAPPVAPTVPDVVDPTPAASKDAADAFSSDFWDDMLPTDAPLPPVSTSEPPTAAADADPEGPAAAPEPEASQEATVTPQEVPAAADAFPASLEEEMADFDGWGADVSVPPISDPVQATPEQSEVQEPPAAIDTPAEAPAAQAEKDGLDALLEDPWLDEAGDPMPAADAPPVPEVAEPTVAPTEVEPAAPPAADVAAPAEPTEAEGAGNAAMAAELVQVRIELEEAREEAAKAAATAAAQTKELQEAMEAKDRALEAKDRELEAAANAATTSAAQTREMQAAIEAKDRELEAVRADAADAAKQTSKAAEEHARELADAKSGTMEASSEVTALQKQIESLGEQLKERDASIAALEEKVKNLDEQLKSRPAEAPRAAAPSLEERSADEFSIPDFVWNCGDSQLLAYVRTLVAENASLSQSQVTAPTVVNGANVAALPAQNTSAPPAQVNIGDGSGASQEDAIKFAVAVGDQDGHFIPQLVVLLREHLPDATVCAQVCAALETLTFTDVEHRQAILGQGGLADLLEVLQHHLVSGELEPVQKAMDALWNITFEGDAKDKLADAAGIECVVEIMRKHGESGDLQASGSAVLLNLAVRERCRWRIVQAGGVEAVVAAMQRFPENKEVLEQGCQVLYMMAFHQDLKPVVKAGHGAEVAQLAAAHSQWGQLLQDVLAC